MSTALCLEAASLWTERRSTGAPVWTTAPAVRRLCRRYRTGDMAYEDDDGFFHLCGRASDLKSMFSEQKRSMKVRLHPPRLDVLQFQLECQSNLKGARGWNASSHIKGRTRGMQAPVLRRVEEPPTTCRFAPNGGPARRGL